MNFSLSPDKEQIASFFLFVGLRREGVMALFLRELTLLGDLILAWVGKWSVG